jgi:hypothetical protein
MLLFGNHTQTADENQTGRLSDRKILRVNAGHNLSVRNLPVKEFQENNHEWHESHEYKNSSFE